MQKKTKFACLILSILATAFPGKVFAETNSIESLSNVSQQTGKLTGVVEDDLGPVIGASVVVKGTAKGVATDLNGVFALDGLNQGDVIQISFLGYVTQEIVYDGQTSLSVLLSEDSQQLGEVVVTALGISREAKSLGYAMTTISAKELTKTGSANFATALYGKASGVRIQNTQGGAAGGVSINVRGLSSINGNTQPLVILNGVPVRNGNATTGGSATSDNISGRDFASIGNGVRSNGLVDINPEDIESLSILKGAAATALYGSEAANGAIIITSKKAKGKGVTVDANVILQANFVAQLPPIQAKYGPGTGYASWSGDMLDNEGFHVTADGKLYPNYGASNNQSWGTAYDGRQVQYVNGQPRPYSAVSSEPWKELFRTGFNQIYNVAVSQGSDNANNRFSYTYTDEIPNALSGTYNKHNFNLVGNVKFNEKLSLDYTGNYVVQHFGDRSGADMDSYNSFSSAWGSFVDVPLIRTLYKNSMGFYNNDKGNVYYDADAPHRFLYNSDGFVEGVRSKFWGLFEDDSDELDHRFIASVAPTYKITGWLTAKGRIATDYTTNSQETFNRSRWPAAAYPDAGDQGGGYSALHKTYQINYGDVMLMFDKKLTDNFQLTVNAGWQAREENMKATNIGTNRGLAMDNVFQITNSYKPIETNENTYRKMSLLKTAWVGTIGVGYHDFLFADVTGRQEKSSTLPAGSRDFFYPSASASFLYSEAFSLPQWYEYGKVRVSYGIVGNAPEAYAANMAYTAKSDPGGFVYNQVPASLGNNKLKPETTKEFEIGLESKFLNNRFGFEVSYYNRKISDMLIQVPLAPSSGSSNLWVNSGVMTNAGFEFSINGTPVKTTDFEWVIRTNGGFNDNHIESLAEGIPFIQHGGVGTSNAADTRSYAGRSMGDFYSNPFLVVESGPYAGQRIVNESGEYRTGDREPIANAMPKFVGGIGTSLSYKNWTLDVMSDFRFGGKVFNNMYHLSMYEGVSTDTENREGEGFLPYTYDNGVTKNTGIVLPGVKEDGNGGYVPNDIVIPYEDHIRNAFGIYANGSGMTALNSLADNNWWKLREMALTYSLPQSLIAKTALRSLNISIFGRNLFYIYKSIPNYDPETSNGTDWKSQLVIGQSAAPNRTVGISLRATF